MDFFEVIDKRHNYRGEFLQTPVSADDLRKIIEAGIKAPSGYNKQTTSFVVVDDAELKAQIVALLPVTSLKTAPTVIVVLSEEVRCNYNLEFEIEDYSVATSNILMAATALGYAAVWIDSGIKLDRRAKTIAKLLNVPKGKTVRALIPIGIPAKAEPQNPKQSFEECTIFNKF